VRATLQIAKRPDLGQRETQASLTVCSGGELNQTTEGEKKANQVSMQGFVSPLERPEFSVKPWAERGNPGRLEKSAQDEKSAAHMLDRGNK